MKDTSDTSSIDEDCTAVAAARLNALVIAYHYLPENNGGVQRVVSMKRHLPQHGVDVTLLTHGTGNRGTATERLDNVVRVFDVTRRGVPWPLFVLYRLLQRGSRLFGATGLRHTLWKRNAIRRSKSLIQTSRPDVVIATFPPLETIELALAVCRRHAIPLVVDFRDGLLFEPLDPGLLKSASLARHIDRLEREIIENASAIVTVSDPISDYYRGRRAARVETIANGFEADDNQRSTGPRPAAFRTDRINVVHTGRLARSRAGTHIDSLLDAMTSLHDDNGGGRLLFHFYGEYTRQEVSALKPLVDKGNVVMHGLVSRAESLVIQRQADVLLLVTASGQRSIATGKLFEYLGSGRPILALTKGTAAEAIINETQAGWAIAPDDTAAIRAMLKELAEGRLLDSLKPRPDKIRSYERGEQMERYASLLQDVCATRGEERRAFEERRGQ
ncbi:glycosyltransferase family 4 protein [Paraburkholderia sp. GAS334]|uniref:glycosyltransferase family 4 protein n=1 Tax=Paraburkholderia sp. GAS334 TaxID=3035131 RepID=UPI003D201BBD